MSDLILHHFDASPFAEKVRLMLGLKGLAWRSVEIPMVMPKPDLTALTGGYRKTPVLQIGADVYCDTRLIAVTLEALHPAPTLFPAGDRGLSQMLSVWSDRSFFEPGAALSMALNQRGLPKALIDDRKVFFNFMDFDDLESQIPHLTAQFRAQIDLVDQQLGDGRRFLLGESVGLADINAWFPLWMARANVPTAPAMLVPYERLRAWETRVGAIGHGARSGMTAAEAHAVARHATPLPGCGVDAADALGFREGDRVVIAADDYGRDPVAGVLVSLTVNEVAVRRVDPHAGTVVVHFPRSGYRLTRA